MVEYVDANRVVIRVHDDEATAGEVGVDIYNLVKFTRSNQSTNINQRPAVKAYDVLQRGDLRPMARPPIWANWLWVKI